MRQRGRNHGQGEAGSSEGDKPELENAKLLEKHAQLQGVDPAEMLFGGDGEERLATNLEEEIMTAEDYLDDAEEETA